MIRYIVILVFLLSGCASTTLKTDSEVDRNQFLLLPNYMALSMAEDAYRQEIKNAEDNNDLNVNEEQVLRVKKIAFRLIDQVHVFRDDASDWNWEVNVQKSEEVNAYCMPGGKIMVYSGIIEKTDATDDELAAMIGHEIAHALREHGRERMSTAFVQQVGLIGFAAYLSGKDGNRLSKEVALQAAALGATLFFALPNSREQEREADKIGLELAARAGYNPMAAVSLWRKMDALSDAKIPEFLSTHPSNENRIEDIAKDARKINYLYIENKKTNQITN
ncbi:MAG: M48 family metallopeptidase [Proteobacteria bacterium]|jgi:predicted Zn-dependent protease|nr:M48 family metallopeptidase [Pseudomonadota bacterium]MDA1134101.1 M48 family metallopeptidase [Pseudomonadota bacterium]